MLTFNQERHIYQWHDAAVPSVTQILGDCGFYAHLAPMPDELRDRSMARGSAVHEAVAILARGGKLDWGALDPEIAGYADGFARWQAETGFVATAVEQAMFNERWRYAGTPDLVGRLGDGRTVLVDAKSTVALGPDGLRAARLQTAAYVHFFPKPLALRRIALVLRPDGSFVEEPFKATHTARDFQVFLAALALYNFKRDGGL